MREGRGEREERRDERREDRRDDRREERREDRRDILSVPSRGSHDSLSLGELPFFPFFYF